MSATSVKPKTLSLSDEDIVTSRPKPPPNGIGRVGHGVGPDIVAGGKPGHDPDAAPAPQAQPSDPDA
jgi:hypothetical protein